MKIATSSAQRYFILFLCITLIASESNGSPVIHRVKRGGKGRSARMGSGGGGSYGIVSMASTSGHGKKTIEVDPLALILGAKAIALKVYVISQFLTTTTTPRPTAAAGG